MDTDPVDKGSETVTPKQTPRIENPPTQGPSEAVPHVPPTPPNPPPSSHARHDNTPPWKKTLEIVAVIIALGILVVNSCQTYYSEKSADAAKIVRLVNEAVHKTRELARGLLPVMADAQGLMSALQLWADEVEDIFGVSCKFECEAAVLIHDNAIATHLYHIAQEAVNNALKHGRARNILLRLAALNGLGTLLIADDGEGISEDRQNTQGMGLHIMSYRSAMIGGVLEVRRNTTQGTTVSCVFPMGSA